MEESHWYQRYLCANARTAIKDGENNPETSPSNKKLGKQFRNIFRVYWSVFEEIKNVVLTHDRTFFNQERKDALGFAHGIELLLLGSLYYVGWDTTFGFVETQSDADKEVHRKFHHDLCSLFYSIKSDYIYLPRNSDELAFVGNQYASYGFPGAVSSIDVVHIAWANCPYSWLACFI